jgi:hypothetical protein
LHLRRNDVAYRLPAISWHDEELKVLGGRRSTGSKQSEVESAVTLYLRKVCCHNHPASDKSLPLFGLDCSHPLHSIFFVIPDLLNMIGVKKLVPVSVRKSRVSVDVD